MQIRIVREHRRDIILIRLSSLYLPLLIYPKKLFSDARCGLHGDIGLIDHFLNISFCGDKLIHGMDGVLYSFAICLCIFIVQKPLVRIFCTALKDGKRTFFHIPLVLVVAIAVQALPSFFKQARDSKLILVVQLIYGKILHQVGYSTSYLLREHFRGDGSKRRECGASTADGVNEVVHHVESRGQSVNKPI